MSRHFGIVTSPFGRGRDPSLCRDSRRRVALQTGGDSFSGGRVATPGQNEFDRPEFLALLRSGDGAAYRRLIRRFHGSLVGTASAIIGSRAQAEEVVQDAWLAVFSGIGRFEGRSSLASWLFAIVLNRARTRASRERRLVALPALDGADAQERAVPLERFAPDGHWTEPPKLWDELDPERMVAGKQLWAHVQDAIEMLPAGQKAVIILRDIEAVSAEEACELLSISPENQRVLLHRARGRVRRAIEILTEGPPVTAPVARPAQPPAAGRAPRDMLRRLLGWLLPPVTACA
jgi:RNA polymerase sigma-70 factor (ECF subfamily)